MWLQPEAIRGRLDLVLGPGRYGCRLKPGPKVGGTFSMRCHLQVGPGRRTGIETASSPRTDGEVALAGAAEAFEMGAFGKITAGELMSAKAGQQERATGGGLFFVDDSFC